MLLSSCHFEVKVLLGTVVPPGCYLSLVCFFNFILLNDPDFFELLLLDFEREIADGAFRREERQLL